MMANTAIPQNPVVSIHPMRQCPACHSLVKPTLVAKMQWSSRSNIPGLPGRYVNEPCCPNCGEHNI